MNNALVGKRVAITGTLSVPRQYVYKLLKAVGATPTNCVSRNTDYLVMGELAITKAMPNGISHKLAAAADLRSTGHKIAIISEDDLFSILSPSLHIAKAASW